MLDDPEEGLKEGFQDGRLRHARRRVIGSCICLLEGRSHLILLPLLLLLPPLGLVLGLVCRSFAPHRLPEFDLVCVIVCWNEVVFVIQQASTDILVRET